MIYITDPDASKIVEVLNLDPSGVRLTQAQVNYVHYLVSNLKATGMWQNSLAIYGFVGGTAYKHQWNWKDMRDLNAAFRLAFSGGGTHTAFGYKGNGSDAFANTFLISNTLSVGNNHLSYYSTENTASTSGATEMGALIGGIGDIRLQINANGITRFLSTNPTIIDGINCTLYGSIKGYNIGNILSNSISVYKNSVNLPVQSTLNSNVSSLTALPIYLNAANFNGALLSPSHRTCGFATIGSGLTDTIATTSSHHITVAQSILNRA